MADDKRGREQQADDADRRQRERDVDAELDRSGETEPPVDERALGDLEVALESLAFPVTGAEVVAAAGEREVDAPEGRYTVQELVPDSDEETFDAPATLRNRVRRPTIAAAMKRIVEANRSLPNAEFSNSRRDAYEKTLVELKAIDADDDDEGVRVITDWILERIREDGTLPGSRDVRREAASFCRSNGYQIRNDEWLGI